MKKLFLLLAVLFCSNSYAQDLPKGLLPSEMDAYQKLIYGNFNKVITTDDPNPPGYPVRTMAEWEQLQGLTITWTSYTTILRQIVDYAQDECMVYIVCSDSNSVKTFLTNGGVPLVNLKFVIAPFNSVWCRDYGPWSVYRNTADTTSFVDWVYNRPRPGDDATPNYLATTLGINLFTTTVEPNRLVNTGGNFMVDGNGTGFASKLVLEENPGKTEAQIDGIMNSYMGLTRYIKMNTLPYDGIHHIDMHMKLLDEETLLVGQYPNGVADGPQIEANLQYVLSNFLTCYGRPYKVVRIPMPPSSTGQYPPASSYFTYTNSVFVNKTVIVPIYGFAMDTTALRIYRENLPGYRVVGINCASMISASGAIHCITKEIGVYNPIFISHKYQRNTDVTNQPYQIKSYIKSKSGIANAKLFWRTDTLAAYNEVIMSAVGDTFTANIPARPLGTDVYYYISATANDGRVTNKPLTAPTGYTKFRVDNLTNISGNSSLIDGYALNQNYPNPFNPATKINFSIPENGYVTLKVFDVTGREVANLVNDFKFAGSYTYDFSASNLGSGVYFYKLESNNFSDVKKMLLVK
ncbi:MAG TPA: hypothetical protein DEP28_03790 [Bacteroidetes bacterium]|nr:agmatine deiminase family protein [Ignavibacteria bacterium]HCA42353.1 hypothetical protein [Bacteroidota bacterium]HCN36277.1 hypothetical protein [Bacteroidota bacterium]